MSATDCFGPGFSRFGAGGCAYGTAGANSFPRYQREDYTAAYAALRAVGSKRWLIPALAIYRGTTTAYVNRAGTSRQPKIYSHEPNQCGSGGGGGYLPTAGPVESGSYHCFGLHDLGYVASHFRQAVYLNRRLSLYHPGKWLVRLPTGLAVKRGSEVGINALFSGFVAI